MYLFELQLCLNAWLGVGLLDQMVTLFQFFEEPPCCSLFSIYIPTDNVRWFPFLHTLSNACYFRDFLMMAILTSVRWYLIVDLICVTLIITNVVHLFTCLWLSVLLLWRNVFIHSSGYFRSSAQFLIALFCYC